MTWKLIISCENRFSYSGSVCKENAHENAFETVPHLNITFDGSFQANKKIREKLISCNSIKWF